MAYSFGKFPVKVSARHIHLRQETVDRLFGAGTKVEPADGTPHGQFLSTLRVTVVGPKHSFERVAVMGPCRNFDQFEMSATDARMMGLPAVLRASGDIEGTPGVKVIGPAGEVELPKGAIVAERHIHMGPKTAEANGLKEGDYVLMCVESEGRTTIFGHTAIHTNGPDNGGALSHIDTDEGNACGAGKAAVGWIAGKMEELHTLFPDT
jgi:putative phosphotransacetylase